MHDILMNGGLWSGLHLTTLPIICVFTCLFDVKLNATKKVYFKVKNSSGQESAVVSDTITLSKVLTGCKYVGTCSGTFSGDDHGTWSGTIDNNCRVNSTSYSDVFHFFLRCYCFIPLLFRLVRVMLPIAQEFLEAIHSFFDILHGRCIRDPDVFV